MTTLLRAVSRDTLLLAVILAAGCATPSAPPADAEPKFPPLARYAADPFVPINLYLNADEHLPDEEKQLVEYAAERLRESGAFVRVDRGVNRWPITVQARLQRRTGGEAARRVLSILTLGLVPVHVTQEHTLFAEIFAEPSSVAALELTATVHRRVSLYDFGDRPATERTAVDGLLERLVGEIAQRNLIPRWNAVAPEPPKKKKKAPVGRPT